MNAAAFQDAQNFDKGTVEIFVQYTSGAAGAIPSTLTNANGVASVVRSGVGTIVVTLTEPAFSLLYAGGEIRPVTFTIANGCYVNQKTDAISTTGAVTFEFRTANGSAAVADTASGDVVQFVIVVQQLAP